MRNLTAFTFDGYMENPNMDVANLVIKHVTDTQYGRWLLNTFQDKLQGVLALNNGNQQAFLSALIALFNRDPSGIEKWFDREQQYEIFWMCNEYFSELATSEEKKTEKHNRELRHLGFDYHMSHEEWKEKFKNMRTSFFGVEQYVKRLIKCLLKNKENTLPEHKNAADIIMHAFSEFKYEFSQTEHGRKHIETLNEFFLFGGFAQIETSEKPPKRKHIHEVSPFLDGSSPVQQNTLLLTDKQTEMD
ncbi:MAG: hypothetical protein FWE01_00620 [Firmicutes bacterium]|nr:hypothetical protein [Bacillota bacterium]